MAVLLLIVLSPFMMVIGLVVRITSGSPVLYSGERVGRSGVTFKILKFRTMVVEHGGEPRTTSYNDPRVTTVGRWLRRYKLDELPQLVNVVRGEMSLVGPRPEFLQWVEMYDGEAAKCLLVRPGITDLASLEYIALDRVVGPGNADARYLEIVFRRKNELRVAYVDNWCWRLDMKILAKTLVQLFSRVGRS